MFLGEDAARGGPFALLDVKYAPIDEAIVRRAVRRALARINDHPRSNTPGAAEVRLAVHAAASQLLDPGIRTKLAARCPEGSGLDGPAAWRAGARRAIDPRLIARARAILGASGGWNARSRKRLGQFARFHRINALRLIGALAPTGAGKRVVSDREGRGQGVLGSVFKPIDLGWLDRADRLWWIAPVVFGVLGLALVGVFVGTRGMEESGAVPGGVELADSVGERERAEPVLDDRVSDNATARGSGRTHYSAIVHELGVASRVPEGQGNPEAVLSLGERFVTRWREFDRDSLAISVGSLGTALKRLDDEGFKRASGFLEARDGEPGVMRASLRILWFGAPEAMLERASMEATMDLGDAIVKGGAHVAGLSSDDPEWWGSWIRACEAIEMLKRDEGVGLLRSSVAQRMRSQLQDESGWNSSAERIVGAMDWGRGKGSRIWLLTQIADSKVRSDRLSGFMNAMITHSSAGGVSLETALGTEATMEEREWVLARLREAWILAPDGSDADDPRLDLIKRIEELARLSASPSNERSSAIRAIELAQLNRVCDRWDVGDEGAMFRGIDLFADSFSLDESEPVRVDLASSRADEAWANAARNTEDPGELARLIDQVGSTVDVGPWTAHGLVYLAMQAPDLGIRDQAAGVVLRLQDSAVVLVALDRVLVTSRPSRRMLSIVDAYLRGSVDLESDRDREEAELRREIVQRLSAMVGNGGDSVLADLERTLRRGYGSQDPIGVAEGVVRRMERGLIDRGEGGSDRRAAVRAMLMARAGSDADRYVVVLDSLVRVLADRARFEHPGVGTGVDAIVEEYEAMMRRETSSAGRIKGAHRAQAMLWRVMIEAEIAS